MKIGQTRPHPEWRIIVDLLGVAQYGELVSHAAIAEATGLRAETRRYYRHVSHARKILLNHHHIETESVAGKGYKRVEPSRYPERSRRDVKLGGRRIKRARTVLEATPVQMLTAEQVKEVEQGLLKLNLLSAQINSTVRSMRNALAPVRRDTPLLTAGSSGEESEVH